MESLEICSIQSQDQVTVKGAGRGRIRDQTDDTKWDGCWFTMGATDVPAFGVPNVVSRHVVDAIIGPGAARKGWRKADNRHGYSEKQSSSHNGFAVMFC